MESTHPALSTAPADGLAVLDVRARLSIAVTVTALNEALAINLAAALANPSPPVALCDAFNVLRGQEDLPPVIIARAIECAECIAGGQFHGLAEAAGAYAAAQRAALAS